MVSTKIIFLAVVLFACVIHTQAALSDDGDKKTDSGSGGEMSLGGTEALKRFREIMSEISKNPQEAIAIISKSLKGRVKGASKNKGSEKEGDKA